MHFRETPIEGAFIIAPERHNDERGFFARTFCTHEFAAHGLDTTVAQCNLSHNAKRGTLRGMHYQRRPSSERSLSAARAARFLMRLSICDQSRHPT